MQDTTHTLAKSARRFFSGTMLSRLTGLLRDMAMGAAFGTQEAVAAFLVAFRLSHLMRRLLGEGALQTAFVPQFEKLKGKNPKQAGLFFRDLNVALTLLLSLLIGIAMAGLGGALLFIELAPGNREIILLTLLMMPSLLFICLFGLNTSLLQCEKSYFTPSVAPVAFNLVWVAGVICLWTLSPAAAMPWLSLFIIFACVAQWLFTLPKALKIIRQLGVEDMGQGLSFYTKELGGMLKPLFLGIAGVAASQVSNALDPLFARYADPEGPAFLWYAIRVQQLPLALFGIAISGALLPPLSRASTVGDWPKFRQFLDLALRKGLALMLPITVAIFLLGDRSISLLYGRGEFSNQAVLKTTQCLWAYGVGLIPMTLVLFLAPAFYAQHNYRVPTLASLFSVGLNLLLNTLLVTHLGCGAAAVALSTSLCAWVNFAILACALRKNREVSLEPQFFYHLSKVTFATAAAAAICWIALSAFGQELSLKQIATGVPPSFSRHFADQATQLVLPSALFGLSLLATAWIVKAEDILALLRK